MADNSDVTAGKGEADPAAILGVAVAVTAGAIVSPGPYTLVSTFIGLTLFSLLGAYYRHYNTPGKQIAFGATFGVCAWLTAAVLLEWMLGGDYHHRTDSSLDDYWAFGTWLIASIVGYLLIRLLVRAPRQSKQGHG